MPQSPGVTCAGWLGGWERCKRFGWTRQVVTLAKGCVGISTGSDRIQIDEFESELQVVKTAIEFQKMRNCFRCGREFRSDSCKRVCPDCAVPRGVKRPLNSALSLRERQVVHLVCKAKLNKEIAHELHLTEGTVKEYLNRIFRKSGASNRTELAVWAIRSRIAVVAEGPAPTP